MYNCFISDINGWPDMTCFYDATSPSSEVKIISPKLILEDNAAGSFEFIITSDNVCYDNISLMDKLITITYNDEAIWDGRIIESERDFYNNKRVFCEGALAFLNDTIQPYKVYKYLNLRQYISVLLSEHNKHCDAYKQINVGVITVNPKSFKTENITNYETTYELISALTEEYGGHFRIRINEKGVRFLDYLKEYPKRSKQLIEFGVNLLDFSELLDMTNYCTVVTPIGAPLKDEEGNELDERLTCSSVNNGSLYISSDDGIKAFGWINKVVEFEDVEDPELLYELGLDYLNTSQYTSISFDVKAIDLSYQNRKKYFSPPENAYYVLQDSEGKDLYDSEGYLLMARPR